MSLNNIGDSINLFGYTNKLVASNTNKNKTRKERIIRVFNADKKVMDKNKIIDYVSKGMRAKKDNQSVMLRIFTDAGWRTIKKLYNDTINWLEEEEYLRDTKNPNARPYKEVYFMDVHMTENL
jgi:exopolysaccharide biosynthesis predicted pyruvyltransferase EpsI